jgi:hypothetical protein
MVGVLHSLFVDSCHTLAHAFSEQLLDGASQYRSESFNLTLFSDDDEEYSGELALNIEDLFVVKVSDLTYRFSAVPQAATISTEVFERRNFALHNLTLSKEDFLPGYFSWLVKDDDWDTIIINQVSSLYKSNAGYLKNLKTEEVWSWRKGEVTQFESPYAWDLLMRLVRAIGSYFLISNITALMCRMSIISSAAVLISLQTCCGFCDRNENTQLMMFYSFPWIGQSLYALRNSGRRSAELLTAYFTMFLTFYFMYACCYFVWTLMVFSHILPEGLDDNFFTLINMLEFFSLVFLRSKRSIAYFPRAVACSVLLFMLYRLNHFYGFLVWAFLALLFFTVALMCAVIGYFEYSAFYSLSRPPTYDAPRLTYQALLRSTTTSPELWTIFYPTHSATEFNAREMQQVHPI